MFRITVFLLPLFGLPLQAETLVVCDSCEHNSIAAAVQRAESGDTLRVEKGVYNESEITIDKPLTIIGQELPVVDGGGKGIFHITSDGVAISGLRLTHVKTSYTKDQAAIHIFGSKDFRIQDNVLDDVFFGILLEKSHDGKVIGNKVESEASDEYNSGNGIHLWHCSNVLISGNETSGMRDGIYFEFVENSQVENNRSFNNIRYGLHFMFSNDNGYQDNVFTDNGAGVAVMFSKNIEMRRNRFAKNWGSASYGLLLKEINDAEIVENIFEENSVGITAEGSNRIEYYKNTFKNNGWAVKITGACYHNTFSYNNYLSNAFELSYKGSLNNNVFQKNYWSEYTGYDLNRDGIGDVPYRPVKLFSYIANRTPESIVLLRSLFVDIINFSERVSPIFTPAELVDEQPLMVEAR